MKKRPAVKFDGTKTPVKTTAGETTAPAAETKAAPEVKAAEKQKETKIVAEVQVETAPAAETETVAEEKPAKKTRAPRGSKTAKKAEKAVKAELKPEVFIQYQGREAVVADAIEKAKAEFVADGHRVSTIKSLQVYLKPEENAAYYVINRKFAGRVDLF